MNEPLLLGAIGHSITAGEGDETGKGWFGRLTERLASEKPLAYECFHNMSYPGDRVFDTLHRFSSEVMSRELNILIVETGANDINRFNAPDAPLSLSAEERTRAWCELLRLIRMYGAKTLVLDIMPVIEVEYLATDSYYGSGYKKNSDLSEYNKLIGKLCAEYRVPFFKRFDRWLTRPLEELYLDTIHPNAKGCSIMAEEIYEGLKKEGFI